MTKALAVASAVLFGFDLWYAFTSDFAARARETAFGPIGFLGELDAWMAVWGLALMVSPLAAFLAVTSRRDPPRSVVSILLVGLAVLAALTAQQTYLVPLPGVILLCAAAALVVAWAVASRRAWARRMTRPVAVALGLCFAIPPLLVTWGWFRELEGIGLLLVALSPLPACVLVALLAGHQEQT